MSTATASPDLASLLTVTNLAAAVVLYYASIAAFKWLQYRRNNDVPRLRGPKSESWLWGHEKEAFVRSYGDAYSEWIDKYGDVVKIQGALGYGDILVVADRSVLSHIFVKRVYDYPKSAIMRPMFERILGRSMVWAEGEDHRRMKNIVGPSFSEQNVRGMEAPVLESANRLAQLMRSHVTEKLKKEGNLQGTVLTNALDWTSRATLDIIGKVGFAYDFKCGESFEAQEIMRMWREFIDDGLSMAGFVAPIVLRAMPWIASLPVKSLHAQGAVKMAIRRLTRGIAEEKVAAVKEKGTVAKTDKDLLSLLVRASAKSGAEVDVDELLDHINTFVMVGHETTSAVLSYTLNALAQHPDVQDKLRAELEEFGREPVYEDFSNPTSLPYLDAVTKEALRVFPAGAHTERVAAKDDVIELESPLTLADGTKTHTLRIKKGQILIVPFLSINTHTTAWGPDGNVFRPSRWLSDTPLPKVQKGGWNNMASFTEGPHLCVGYRLAIFEFKAIISALVRTLRFEDTGLKVENKFLATLQPFVVDPSVKDDEEYKGAYMPLKMGLVDQE